ncbi:MAG: tetratricopeptide repeat protein [Gemmataceae bacterium]|nr:tetratricopeptide repeat protein [Gemmataceae bacterium]
MSTPSQPPTSRSEFPAQPATSEVAPQEIETWLLHGDEHMEKQAWSKAIDAYVRVVAAHVRSAGVAPRLSEAFRQRGVHLLNVKKDVRRATRAFDRAIQFASDGQTAARAYVSRGRLHLQEDHVDSALADFTEAIRLDAAQPDAYLRRGEAFHEQKRFPEAVADFTEALRLGGDNADVYFARGLARALDGKFDAAIEDFSAAIQLEPNRATAYANRGLAFFRLDQHEKAMADCDKALEIDPNYPQALLNRAYVFRETGDLPRAVEEFSRLIDDDSYEDQARTGRAKT